jgi:EAL domain-containing protein (putative c-di-GMP-specific phosphodiesterase class I)
VKQRDAAQLAEAVAGHIRQALQTPFTIATHEVYVGVSTGVAVYPVNGDDAASLLREASAAMSDAREHGRGGGVAERRAPSDQLKLTTRLRHAVTHNEFVLHYQPVCDIARNLIIGVEALIRWNDPERGLIGPDEFIHLAERTGMITQISDWVVSEACRQSRAWRDQGVRVGVSVNLPPILWQPSMVARLRSEVSKNGLKPSEFMIEITESAIMTNPDRSLEILRELSDDGFRMAIDDFGTGYSSLARLRQMPVSALKIDRSFITDLPGDQDAEAIVNTIIQLSANLGLVALAEGIETEEQLQFLTAHGCQLGQGFLLSRPVPGEEIPDIYRRFERDRPRAEA